MAKKNSETAWRWIRIVLPVGILLLATVFAYGKLNNRVETLEAQTKEFQKTRESVIRMEEGIEYLKKAVDRIELKVDKWPWKIIEEN